MTNRNYPSKREPAGTWKCPICKKIISIRGKSGHLKLAHAYSVPEKEHSLSPLSKKKTGSEKRPLKKEDVENLITNFHFLMRARVRPNDLLSKRKAYLEFEILVRQLENKFQCTLEEALKKFPEVKFIDYVNSNS